MHTLGMAAELTDADKEILAALLREILAADTIAAITSTVQRLRAVLDKLDPQPVREVMPPPKPPGEPSWAARKRRR